MDRNLFFNIKSIQHICTILKFQYVTKAIFACLKIIKVTFLILCLPCCVFPAAVIRMQRVGELIEF